jgi:hypothetical protein
MIEVWVTAIILIGCFGLGWYLVNIVAQVFIESLTTLYPTYYDATITSLFTNLWMWLGALMTFGLLIWVYINSKKPDEVIMYA